MKTTLTFPADETPDPLLRNIRLSSSPDYRLRCSTVRAHMPTKTPQYEIDSMSLDLSTVLPGARRELGPAFLIVKVDNRTGRIVDAVIRFGVHAATSDHMRRASYSWQLMSATESALSRLLRSNTRPHPYC